MHLPERCVSLNQHNEFITTHTLNLYVVCAAPCCCKSSCSVRKQVNSPQQRILLHCQVGAGSTTH